MTTNRFQCFRKLILLFFLPTFKLQTLISISFFGLWFFFCNATSLLYFVLITLVWFGLSTHLYINLSTFFVFINKFLLNTFIINMSCTVATGDGECRDTYIIIRKGGILITERKSNGILVILLFLVVTSIIDSFCSSETSHQESINLFSG